jgi:hypothetical protein
MNNPKKN